MTRPILVLAVISTLGGVAVASDEIKLPPEVTPAVRAACEADVRRLCIVEGSTVESVKNCVISKYLRLGARCRNEIASAGLSP